MAQRKVMELKAIVAKGLGTTEDGIELRIES